MNFSGISKGNIKVFCKSPIDVLLFDFDINKADLKAAHRAWLSANVIKSLEAQNVRGNYSPELKVVVEGRASRTGTERYNLGLSQKRANNVCKVLKSIVGDCGVKLSMSVIASGESMSQYGDNTEFPIDRSVRIQFRERGQKKLPKIELPEQKVFKLRVLNSHSVSFTIGRKGFGGGIENESTTFQIWDVQESTVANYEYSNTGRVGSIGAGISSNKKGKGGFSPKVGLNHGKWHKFYAPRSMRADDFSGPARLDGSVGLTIGKSFSTARDFRFGGLAESKWWEGPVFNFSIKDLDLGTSVGLDGLNVEVNFNSPDPFPQSFEYVEGSLVTGYRGD